MLRKFLNKYLHKLSIANTGRLFYLKNFNQRWEINLQKFLNRPFKSKAGIGSLLLIIILVLQFATNSVFAYPYGTAVNYTVGTNPYFAYANDFNNDGKQDLAVANYTSGTVSIMIGVGDGTFAEAVNYTVGSGPLSIEAADFDGDGDKDLAVANFTANVSILINNGAGVFATAVNYAAGSSPQSVTTADFNGDNKIDIAVSAWGGRLIYLLLGNGNGTFVAGTSYSLGVDRPIYATASDFNNDGKQDLVVAISGNVYVSVLIGNGNGTFAVKVNYNIGGTSPQFISVADMNGDSVKDFAVANYNTNNVSVLMGVGNGTFGAASVFSAGTGPRSVFASDMNGDGSLDLAVANQGTNNASVLLGNGSGSFAAPVNYAAGTAPRSVVVTDFDGDADQDLAVANQTTNNVSIFLSSLNNPIPTTSLISPTSKNVGDAQFTLTVNGTNFISSSVVRLNGSNRATTYIGSTQLTAIIPATDMLTGAAKNITVYNPSPGGGLSGAVVLTIGVDPYAPISAGLIVSGVVDPTLSFSLDMDMCNLGVLSTTEVKTCSVELSVQTNAPGGYTALIKDNNNGVLSSGLNTIVSQSGTLQVGAAGFGITSSAVTGNIAVNSLCGNSSTRIVTGINSLNQVISVGPGPTLTDTIIICAGAIITEITPAGSYSDLAIITISGNF